MKFDKDKGFFLNNKHLKLKGMCLHQDAGCLGTAVPDRAYERRLLILKDLARMLSVARIILLLRNFLTIVILLAFWL